MEAFMPFLLGLIEAFFGEVKLEQSFLERIQMHTYLNTTFAPTDTVMRRTNTGIQVSGLFEELCKTRKRIANYGANRGSRGMILSQNFGLFIFMINKIINEFHSIL